jgi:hypothetical protein
MAGEKYRDRQQHDGDFKEFHRDQNRALAINVGKMAGVTRNEGRRQNEQECDQLDVAGAAMNGEIQSRERDDDFQEIVVERTKKLRAKEGKKAGLPERVDVFPVGHDIKRHTRVFCSLPTG